MKNGFVVTSLVLVAGYSGAFAAEAFGVLPSGLSVMPGFPLFVAWFAAAGVLALAFRDYARVPTYDAPRQSTAVNANLQPRASRRDAQHRLGSPDDFGVVAVAIELSRKPRTSGWPEPLRQ